MTEQAHARTSDPWTSRAAAASLASDKIRGAQSAVLRFLRRNGPMEDERLVKIYNGDPPQSPSGLRTRRAELVKKGLIADSGKRIVTKSGRKAIVWQVAPGAGR